MIQKTVDEVAAEDEGVDRRVDRVDPGLFDRRRKEESWTEEVASSE